MPVSGSCYMLHLDFLGKLYMVLVKMYVYNHVGYVIEGAVLDWRGRECIGSTTPTIPHLINDT